MSKINTEVSRDEEIAMLKAKLAELEGKKEIEYVEEKQVRPDEYVSVMSLIPYNLNLSTQEGGQGSVKKFTKFGEIKRILYKDLVEILEVNKAFLEAGYFYIMNPQLIRYHGLDEIYTKILTKEKIEDILSTKSDAAIELYNSANEKQQEIIIQLLIDKIKENPDSVNLNFVDKISRLSKIDIYKRAEEVREIDNNVLTEE